MMVGLLAYGHLPPFVTIRVIMLGTSHHDCQLTEWSAVDFNGPVARKQWNVDYTKERHARASYGFVILCASALMYGTLCLHKKTLKSTYYFGHYLLM